MCCYSLNKILITFLILKGILNNFELISASEISATHCRKDYIFVEISVNSSYEYLRAVYLSNLHTNSHSRNDCQVSYQMNNISLKIFSQDFLKCGFARVISKLQDIVLYYQDLVLEQGSGDIKKLPIKCAYKIKKTNSKPKHNIIKRDELPEGFHEDDDIVILETIEHKAPEPQVSLEVRQNDQLIDDIVTVIPGTPLVMEVKLNQETNQIYGLKVNYLEVSDTRDTSETILFRGCTVDPYLFENFNLTSTNSLKAKFRAFKFPNTSYIQFKANVEICLKRCLAPQCFTGNAERLRLKREVVSMSDAQFEVSIGLTMKINDSHGIRSDELLELEKHVRGLKSRASL